MSLLSSYITAGVILLVSIGVAAIASRFARRYIEERAPDAENELVERTTRPVLYLFVFLGVYYATSQFPLTVSARATLDDACFAVIALLVAYILTESAKLIIRRRVQGDIIGDHAPKFLGNVVGIVIFIPAILIVLARFNVEITPILATLGVGSLAVGLALQGTLGNFFAGLRLISEKPIRVGDYVDVLDADVEGFIEDIGWSTTRVRTIRDNIIVVPNKTFVDSNVFNSSIPSPESTVLIEAGVSYDEDLDRVETVCEEVIRFVQDTNPHAVQAEPWVRFDEFDDSNIAVRLGVRVQSYDQRFKVIHELIKAVKKRFDEEGIEISWPIRKVYRMNDSA